MVSGPHHSLPPELPGGWSAGAWTTARPPRNTPSTHGELMAIPLSVPTGGWSSGHTDWSPDHTLHTDVAFPLTGSFYAGSGRSSGWSASHTQSRYKAAHLYVCAGAGETYHWLGNSSHTQNRYPCSHGCFLFTMKGELGIWPLQESLRQRESWGEGVQRRNEGVLMNNSTGRKMGA